MSINPTSEYHFSRVPDWSKKSNYSSIVTLFHSCGKQDKISALLRTFQMEINYFLDLY